MGNFAVFFDRDGTLNEDPGYLGNPESLKLYPNTGKALADLKNKLDLKLIVISNQSGIARRILTDNMVKSVNAKMNELLLADNVSIDAFYYCPYHPDFSDEKDCSCRKPSPEMVFKAAKDLKIDLQHSFFVGDSVSDIECGKNAGLKTILVKTGYGEESLSILQKQNNFPTFVAQNILDVRNIIQKDFNGEN
jgi:histidinol-phosphate phosphatase family protein